VKYITILSVDLIFWVHRGPCQTFQDGQGDPHWLLGTAARFESKNIYPVISLTGSILQNGKLRRTAPVILIATSRISLACTRVTPLQIMYHLYNRQIIRRSTPQPKFLTRHVLVLHIVAMVPGLMPTPVGKKFGVLLLGRNSGMPTNSTIFSRYGFDISLCTINLANIV
jgi:hypothetical protein